MLLVIKDSFGKLMMLLVTEDSKGVRKIFWLVKIFPIINNPKLVQQSEGKQTISNGTIIPANTFHGFHTV